MKKSLLCLALVICFSSAGLAQQVGKPDASAQASARPSKKIRLIGQVSEDGTKFVENLSRKIWQISNLEMLKGYEGQSVELRGQAVPSTNLFLLLSIHPQVNYTARWSDSAFRR